MPSPCASALPEYNNDCCVTLENGGIRGVLIVKKGLSPVDPTDNAAWAALILAGDAWAIPETTGDYDGGSPVTAQGRGATALRTIGYTRVANFKVDWTCENYEFFNNLQKQQGLEFWFMSENHINHSIVTASFVPKDMIAEDLNTIREWAVTVTWNSIDFPTCYELPVPFILDSCATLNDFLNP